MITSVASKHYQNSTIQAICSLGLKNQRLIRDSLNLGLIDDARHLQKIDRHLIGLLHKAAGFDFVVEIARGSTLLVGEGNLSFAFALSEKPQITPGRLVATTFENRNDLTPEALENADALRQRSVTVLFGVDATDLAVSLGSRRFDSIVFQFPHVGSRDAVEGHNPNFILVRDFLISAARQLQPGGQVLISAVDSPHYHGAFQFDDAAEAAGFAPPEVHLFDPSEFPDYEHTMTHQEGSALDNHDDFSTWVFRRA